MKMLSDKELQKLIHQGRQEFISDLQKWHAEQADKERKLELGFCFDAVQEFGVNVWDDYPEYGLTYAYVESSKTPANLCLDILLHLLAYAKENSVIQGTAAKFGIRYNDSSITYPSLIGRDGEYSLSKRWELTVEGVDYNTLSLIVEELGKVSAFNNKRISVYSES